MVLVISMYFKVRMYGGGMRFMRFFCGNPGKMSILAFALETFKTRFRKHEKWRL